MSDEKPLDPSPARIAKARREGNVPRSPELVAAAAFGAGGIAACAVAAPIGALAQRALLAAARGKPALHEEAAALALAMVPATAAAVFAALAGALQAGGLRVTGIALKPERLDPFEGVRRIASRETPAHALRAMVAFAAAIAAIAPAVAHAIVASASAGGMLGVAAASAGGVRRTLFAACAVGLLFAGAEYALVRAAWLRKLRMSLDELKREVKEQDGDPHARGRRRSHHKTLLRGAIAEVRNAAFVVANPTHVAVALAYAPPEIPVPVVLVRAREAAALRVREAAARWRVPVIENAALARALFAGGRAGAPIPAACYVAVAEVVVALARSGALER
ncbi:MAG: EscU/YscU/HrcU family type III secretion system export apparatus switch protein [Candidatus Tyrphobacter sp.]